MTTRIDGDTEVKNVGSPVKLSEVKPGDVLDIGFVPYGHAHVYAVKHEGPDIVVYCSRPYATWDSGILRVGSENFTLFHQDRVYTKVK